jgi:chromosomal replication initiator protein
LGDVRVRTNVRRLEGDLIRVASYPSLSGREISRETVEQLLRDILRKEAKKTVTIDKIQKKVSEHFDVRIVDMTGKRAHREYCIPAPGGDVFSSAPHQSLLA